MKDLQNYENRKREVGKQILKLKQNLEKFIAKFFIFAVLKSI